VLIMLIALFATSQITTIDSAAVFLIECGAGLGLVLILRWYWWRINAYSEITASLAPFIAYTYANYIMHWEYPNNFLFTVGFSTIAWLLVTYLTPATDASKLESFYLKVRPEGSWGPLRRKFHPSG